MAWRLPSAEKKRQWLGGTTPQEWERTPCSVKRVHHNYEKAKEVVRAGEEHVYAQLACWNPGSALKTFVLSFCTCKWGILSCPLAG